MLIRPAEGVCPPRAGPPRALAAWLTQTARGSVWPLKSRAASFGSWSALAGNAMIQRGLHSLS
jgi:hypothetical protein